MIGSAAIDPARIAVALDVLDVPSALRLADELVPLGVRWFKVGLDLWIHGGPDVVRALKDRGVRVFLDLKLHDIPHQVALATAAAAQLGAELLTIHASGGREMIRAAVGAAGTTKILAVTVLTSLSAAEGEVARLAALAHGAGAHGVVCSPLEAAELRARYAPPFLLVTPGIRPADASADDQQRTATPEAAIAAGSDLLVIGRPITGAPDPAAAVRRLMTEN